MIKEEREGVIIVGLQVRWELIAPVCGAKTATFEVSEMSARCLICLGLVPEA